MFKTKKIIIYAAIIFFVWSDIIDASDNAVKNHVTTIHGVEVSLTNLDDQKPIMTVPEYIPRNTSLMSCPFSCNMEFTELTKCDKKCNKHVDCPCDKEHCDHKEACCHEDDEECCCCCPVGQGAPGLGGIIGPQFGIGGGGGGFGVGLARVDGTGGENGNGENGENGGKEPPTNGTFPPNGNGIVVPEPSTWLILTGMIALSLIIQKKYRIKERQRK